MSDPPSFIHVILARPYPDASFDINTTKGERLYPVTRKVSCIPIQQHAMTDPDPSPCTLFAITQFECMATDRVTCWPIERIFRQCKDSPAMEVTNRLVHSGNDGKDGNPVVPPLVEPAFIANPPNGNEWKATRL